MYKSCIKEVTENYELLFLQNMKRKETNVYFITRAVLDLILVAL